MNWIILYLACFGAIILSLAIGYLYFKKSKVCIDYHKDSFSSSGLTAIELAKLLVAQENVKLVDIATINSKKTDLYSAKYNVIKLSPETSSSNHLYSLAVGAKCVNHATRQQNYYITSAFRHIFSFISKIFAVSFLPIILISAILNISFGLEKLAFITTLVFLIGFVLGLIYSLVMLFVNESSYKDMQKTLSKLNLLSENEVSNTINLMVALNNSEFFKFTRLSLSMFLFLSPTAYIR